MKPHTHTFKYSGKWKIDKVVNKKEANEKGETKN